MGKEGVVCLTVLTNFVILLKHFQDYTTKFGSLKIAGKKFGSFKIAGNTFRILN